VRPVLTEALDARRGGLNDAVSPVIATVLLLAITVLLTSGIYLMVSDATTAPEKGRPYCQATARSLDNGYQVVRITELSNELMTSSVLFQVIPPSNSNASIISGFVNDADVYGAVGVDVSFHDRDAGLTVNRGDYFIIDATRIGSGDGDWTFRLFFEGGSGRSAAELTEVVLPATPIIIE